MKLTPRPICCPHSLFVLFTFACIAISFGCERNAVSEQTEDPPKQEANEPADEQSDPSAEQPAAPDERPAVPDETPESANENAIEPEHPFPRRISIPDFPKDMEWLNTSGPLRKQDLKGKFVILDFWTYCCINCIHILPELKKLERKYPAQLVVIGVHSAKFETEKESKNIEEAILRYEIEHPVVNDAEHRIWNTYGVSSWPTMLLIDPEGNAVWGTRGEVRFEDIDPILARAIPYYRDKKLLDETPIRFDLLAHRQEMTPLRFPSKVLADEATGRLFISDSNHNRIVIATLDGKLVDLIGSGSIGRKDGSYDEASFDHPQGMTLNGNTLYVADTENHLLRKIDLEKKQVTTIAGTGVQARNPWPGLEDLGPLDELPERWVGPPGKTAINSPWDLWVHEKDLYIAMAGPHQIWKMPLNESEIGPYAGNGREDIVDGVLLPERPYETSRTVRKDDDFVVEKISSFAQPSGLSSDGAWLYVADSEGSSIRAVPFDPNEKVRTVVGTADLPFGRLFEFGDVDGPREKVRLQHPLCVVYHDGMIYVADTYNNKIKAVDAKTGETHTLAGTGKPGADDAAGTFDEPTGITIANGRLYVGDTNNHAIRTIDIETGKVSTLAIEGLTSPSPPKEKQKPTFPGAKELTVDAVSLKPADGAVALNVELKLPDGWKINPLAPMGYFVEAVGDSGPIHRSKLSEETTKLAEPASNFTIELPVKNDEGSDQVRVAMTYYYCQEGAEGLCKVGNVVWTVPIRVANDAAESSVRLTHQVEK